MFRRLVLMSLKFKESSSLVNQFQESGSFNPHTEHSDLYCSRNIIAVY